MTVLPGDGARIASFCSHRNSRGRGLELARERWWLRQVLNRRLRERTHARQQAARNAARARPGRGVVNR